MKHLLTILFFCISFNVHSQITTSAVSPVAGFASSQPYDSMQNYLGENLHQYIGQELYLNEYPKGNFREYGYSGFFIDYAKTGNKVSNFYKAKDDFGSKYSDLAGKYFIVIDVVKPEVQESFLGSVTYFLKLKERESNDVCYYKYVVNSSKQQADVWKNRGRSIPTFPFIVTGYFQKQKSICVGKVYVFSDKIIQNETDFKTGKPITPSTGDSWKCIDLTIDTKYYLLSIVAENTQGEQMLMPYSNIVGKWSKGRTYTSSEVENNIKLFGKDNFVKLLKGEVSIGMSKEMCRLSWGEPSNINETITAGKKSEQWVYEKNYLYFDNDVLTAIQ